MRNLKLRVWCKGTNHFTDSPFYACAGNQLLWLHSGNQLTITNLDDESEYVVQQFTGLKDRAGLDIYEGDILERDNTDYLYKCEYSEPEAAYMLRDQDNDGALYLADFVKNLKVVGNIFEPSKPAKPNHTKIRK